MGKGTVKRRRCNAESCKKLFTPSRPMQDVCSLPCSIEWSKTKDAAKAAQKAFKAESVEFKKKVLDNDTSHQHKLTKTQFNRMRVLEELKWFQDRGIEPYCISCRRTKLIFCCGHLKTVGAQGNLRYDRMNTYLQCSWRCNSKLSGNINGDKTSIGYKAGLILRFGEQEGQKIIDYCDTHTDPIKWYWEDLKIFRAECSANIRMLEKQL